MATTAIINSSVQSVENKSKNRRWKYLAPEEKVDKKSNESKNVFRVIGQVCFGQSPTDAAAHLVEKRLQAAANPSASASEDGEQQQQQSPAESSSSPSSSEISHDIFLFEQRTKDLGGPVVYHFAVDPDTHAVSEVKSIQVSNCDILKKIQRKWNVLVEEREQDEATGEDRIVYKRANRVFTGASPHNAAKKAANRNITNILLQEVKTNGHGIIHVYEGSRIALNDDEITKHSEMIESRYKGIVKKLRTIKLEQPKKAGGRGPAKKKNNGPDGGEVAEQQPTSSGSDSEPTKQLKETAPVVEKKKRAGKAASAAATPVTSVAPDDKPIAPPKKQGAPKKKAAAATTEVATPAPVQEVKKSAPKKAAPKKAIDSESKDVAKDEHVAAPKKKNAATATSDGEKEITEPPKKRAKKTVAAKETAAAKETVTAKQPVAKKPVAKQVVDESSASAPVASVPVASAPVASAPAKRKYVRKNVAAAPPVDATAVGSDSSNSKE